MTNAVTMHSGLDILETAAAAIPSLGNDLIAFRREMHADPEIGLHLPRTQARVLEALQGLDLEITLGTATTSVVAVLRGGGTALPIGTRPTVLLRGDMDALPVTEKTGVPFASRNGAMHACGHDLHTSGLIGAARLLTAVRDELPGDVLFMFQPGEEGHNGARVMLDEGVLTAAGTRPLAAYGVHMASDAPAGVFTTRPGSYMAAFGELNVKVLGRGGHGSRPFQTLDPVQVAAEMVGSLQTFITRRFNVFDPVILTVGEFHGGTAANVIPDSAEFKAGVRSFSPTVEARLIKELPELIRGLATAHQLTAEVSFTPKLPATINNDTEAGFWGQTAITLFGEERFELLPFPKAGSEDFSRVLMEIPGAFGHLGAGSPEIDPAEWAPIHSPRAVFDDSVLEDQARFLAGLALGKLQEQPVTHDPS
ncbi:MAG: M20 metallopeptidase family protein [Actinomycetota bacterium]